MKKLLTLFSVVLLTLFACERSNEDIRPELDSGNLLLQLELKSMPPEVNTMSGTLTRDGYRSIEFDLEIRDQIAFAMVHGIVEGTWDVSIYAYDISGDIVHSGSTMVEVIAGEITPVHLDMLNSGSLEITVIWGEEQPVTGNDRFEDNDEIGESTTLTEGNYYQNLNIESGDDDWFSITLSAPHIGIILNYRDHHGDVRAELYSADGTLLARSKHLHDYSIIDYYAPNHGTLYVRVYTASGQSRNYMIWWQDWYDF